MNPASPSQATASPVVEIDDAPARNTVFATLVGTAGARSLSSKRRQPEQIDRSTPCVWGLSIAELHDRYWRSRGIQVIRRDAAATVDLDADLYLLAENDALAIFNPAAVADRLYWNRSSLMRLRLHDHRRRGYEERVVLDTAGDFKRIERIYDRLESRLVRFALTSEARVAQAWIECASESAPWRQIRRQFPRRRRSAASVPGSCYFDDDGVDRAEFVRHLTQVWQSPDASIPDIERCGTTWKHRSLAKDAATKFVGPVWLGHGRGTDEPPLVVGPGVMWDLAPADPKGHTSREVSRPTAPIAWGAIPPTTLAARTAVPRFSRRGLAVKRLFDIGFASFALVCTAPIYPAIMLAIWLEDGGPFLFGHAREKRGGVEFRCWKFRSMRADAEAQKASLAVQNQADGPQFFIANDPRVTRVGRFLRRFNLDELPQFWNVLKGDMSIVGPRPSPRRENQFCPPWRDTRLSVRPGITGLWQVCRSRKGGNDFQEWIKYDLEYVQRSSLRLDLLIIWRSVHICLRGESKSS